MFLPIGSIERVVVTWLWKSPFTVRQTCQRNLRASLTVTASVVLAMSLMIWNLLVKKMTISDLAFLGIEEFNIPAVMRIK